MGGFGTTGGAGGTRTTGSTIDAASGGLMAGDVMLGMSDIELRGPRRLVAGTNVPRDRRGVKPPLGEG